MDSLNNKRACTSYRITISVDQVKRYMNCSMNSVGATLRQVCEHINNKTLFSYEEDYTIGC